MTARNDANRPAAEAVRTAAPPSSAPAAAAAVASADALRARVAQLERALATEREQTAARAAAVEKGVGALKKSLHEMHEEVQRSRAEIARLEQQLEQSRRMVATMCAAADEEKLRQSAAARASDDAAADLARLRDELGAAVREAKKAAEKQAEAVAAAKAAADAHAAAERESDELRSRVRSLEADLDARDLDLGRSGDRITELESEVRTLRTRTLDAEGGGTSDSADAHDMLTVDSPEVAAFAGAKPPAAVERAAVAAADAAAAAAAKTETPAAPAAPEGPDPSFPQIPGLRIERLVEEGATGRVFDAREVESRRPVVVRVLPGVLKLLDGKRVDSILLAKHPSIVAVLSFAVCRQGPYLVMEREEGEPADAWVRRIGPLPEKVALSVALEVARGMRQAAFHGALHGDLGPDSILVDVTGRVRVRGVGLRAVYSLPPDDVRAPAFASPERLRGSPPPDVRSDIYSLGAVLYFLVTGKLVYEGARDAILRQQTANSLPDARETRADVSEDTARLLRKLLQSDPDLRPQTWDQLLVEFERRVPGRVSAALRGNLKTRVRRFFQAYPWVLGGALAGVLLLAGIWRMAGASDPSAADRFREACAIAEKLKAAGDVEGARATYRRFLSGTGDAAVEREAARLYDSLR